MMKARQSSWEISSTPIKSLDAGLVISVVRRPTPQMHDNGNSSPWCCRVCDALTTCHAEWEALTERGSGNSKAGRWMWVPLTPERSKEESWEQAAQRGGLGLWDPPIRSWYGHLPPRHAWMKNILGLFWSLGQFALSKSLKISGNCGKDKAVSNVQRNTKTFLISSPQTPRLYSKLGLVTTILANSRQFHLPHKTELLH